MSNIKKDLNENFDTSENNQLLPNQNINYENINTANNQLSQPYNNNINQPFVNNDNVNIQNNQNMNNHYCNIQNNQQQNNLQYYNSPNYNNQYNRDCSKY